MGKKIMLIAACARQRALLQTHLGALDYAVDGVDHGLAAARKMRAVAPDLILIDQSVPMGGIKTARLLRLHPRYQQLPIVLLLEHEKVAAQLLAEGQQLNLSQYLLKPFSGAALQGALEKGFRESLQKIDVAQMREELGQLASLPVLRANQRKIMSLLGGEDNQVDIPELVRAIEADQGMATRVLRICRSAFYSYRGNTLEGAITFLGVEKLRKVAQAAIVFDVLAGEYRAEESDGFSIGALWQHALACGVITEMAGQMVRGRDHFIAGMLHDVGKVVLYLRFPDYFAEVRRMVCEEGQSMYRAERELIGLSHADIGYELARKWELPPTIAASIAFHHVPDKAIQHRRLISLVHLSDILARALKIGHPGDLREKKIDPCAQTLAKYTFAAAKKKEQIAAQVESLMGGVGGA